MDSTLKAAWIGAVAGFVVWFFSWLWRLWTDRRARNRIRSMIRIEIDDNLDALHLFLEAVDRRVSFTSSPLARMQRGDALSALDLPMFSHRIWEALTASVPVGLNETEIQKVHRFHAKLDELARLKGLSHDTQSQWHREVDTLIDAIVSLGNPLHRGAPPNKALQLTAR
jgi:hypothetical protein